MVTATWCKMSKKKAKRAGFESADKLNSCVSCERIHDVKLGGWVILASGELICDPVDRHDCWEKVHDKRRNDNNARRPADQGKVGTARRSLF